MFDVLLDVINRDDILILMVVLIDGVLVNIFVNFGVVELVVYVGLIG